MPSAKTLQESPYLTFPSLPPQTNTALDQTNSSLLSTRDRLANLSVRLGRLEGQLAQNLAALSVARGFTEEAENASAAVDLVSHIFDVSRLDQ